MTEIQRLSDMPKGNSVTLLIYGPAGVGKSDFLGTTGDRTLFIECENRLMTFQSPGFVKRRGNWNPIIHQVTEDFMPDGGSQAIDKIAQIINEAADRYSIQFDTIIVDGATAFNRFAMNKGLELNSKLSRSKTQSNLKALNTEINPSIVSVQDYDVQMKLVANFILKVTEYVKANNKHFIMTAHERISFKEKSNPTALEVIDRIRPGFYGRTFPDEIPGMFDLVWYFEVVGSGDNATYRAKTVGDRSLVAKSCGSGIFQSNEVKPNFLDIVRRIKDAK